MLAIDPGKQTGLARFEGRHLAWCGLLDMDDDPWAHVAEMRKASTCVVEIPVIYTGSNKRSKDILSVSYHAGLAVGVAKPLHTVQVNPREWKGTRPKAIDNKYTLSLLTSAETERVNGSGVLPSQLNHVLDAIGMGLWYLGRR